MEGITLTSSQNECARQTGHCTVRHPMTYSNSIFPGRSKGFWNLLDFSCARAGPTVGGLPSLEVANHKEYMGSELFDTMRAIVYARYYVGMRLQQRGKPSDPFHRLVLEITSIGMEHIPEKRRKAWIYELKVVGEGD